MSRNNPGRRYGQAAALILLSVLSNFCLALPSDRNQPTYIESDRATRNEKTGITVYEGAVKMDKGSIRILADRLTIHSTDNRPHLIVATGAPAHYQQQPAPDKEFVTAKAKTIKYILGKREQLQLIDNASLKQDGATMTGERINYDINASVAKATSNANSNAPTERIKMVIPPPTGATTKPSP